MVRVDPVVLVVSDRACLWRRKVAQADKNGDQRLTQQEFTALAEAWVRQAGPRQNRPIESGAVHLEAGRHFASATRTRGIRSSTWRRAWAGPRPGGRRGGFGPAMFLGPVLFMAVDANKDGSLARPELKERFAKWFGEWDAKQSGTLNEETIRTGLNAALPPPDFGGPGGGPGRTEWPSWSGGLVSAAIRE